MSPQEFDVASSMQSGQVAQNVTAIAQCARHGCVEWFDGIHAFYVSQSICLHDVHQDCHASALPSSGSSCFYG